MKTLGRVHPSWILLSAAWVGLILLKSGEMLRDGVHFLFGIGKPPKEPKAFYYEKSVYSEYDLWRMHEGTVAIFGLILFSGLLLHGLLARMRARQRP